MAADYLHKKYKDMREDFKSMKTEGYMSWKIIEKLAKKYYMSTATVEDIIYENGAYSTKPKEPADKNQLDLFNFQHNEKKRK